MTNQERAYIQWAIGDDTGASSKTIFAVMTGIKYPLGGYTPADESDFGRCHRMLKLFPEWLPRMGEVGAAYVQWLPLVQSWTVLTKLYEENDRKGFFQILRVLNESGHLLLDNERRNQGWKVEHCKHSCSGTAP